ncbi:MAG: hypothetical protein WCG95_01695 [bacterium]
MDTLLLQPKIFSKAIANALNISIVVGLLFSQHIFEGPPILAKEFIIANSAIISPLLSGTTLEKNIPKELSIEEQTQNFNQEIRRKYKTGVIIDVDKGVKHVKLTNIFKAVLYGLT